MAKQVKVIDRGWKKIQKQFAKNTQGEAVLIGVQGNAATEQDPQHGNLTNVQLGAIHEFGKGNVPERPHFRTTFDENQKKYQKELENMAKRISDGASIEGELLLLGEMARKDILDKINSQIPPPLAEATVEQKAGEQTPLINTGIYRGSISSVRKKLTEVDRSGN